MKYSVREKLYRVLSVTLVYALLLQEFMPLARAMNQTDFYCRFRNQLHSNFNSFEKDELVEPDVVSANDLLPVSNVEVDQSFQKENSEGLESISIATGGPGQSESSGYSVNSTSDLVDKFTGDFSYSIPLMDVEGYPINISYNSNVTMTTDASWVGLGWDLNVGSVSREMRGIPDEFNGEQTVTRTFNQKDYSTNGNKFGGFIGAGLEIDNFFLPAIQFTLLKGKYDNTYIGDGRTFDFGLQAEFSIGEEFHVGPTFGIGYSKDTKNGRGKNTSIGLAAGTGQDANTQIKGNVTYGKSFNSRMGVTSKSIGLDMSFSVPGSSILASYGTGTSLKYGTQTSVPSIPFRSLVSGTQTSTRISVGYKTGNLTANVGAVIQTDNITNSIDLDNNSQIVQPAIGYFHSGKRDQYNNSGDYSYPIMDFNRSREREFSENMSDLDFSVQTYDIFRANAAGFSATFRGRRTDFGTYYDATNTTETGIDSYSPSAGVEFELPLLLKITAGFAYSLSAGEVKGGNFKLSGSNLISFNQQAKSDSFDESVYFKGVGEPTPEDMDAYTYMGGESAAYFDFDHQTDNTISLTNTLNYYGASPATKSSTTLNSEINNVVRSNQYIPLTVADMPSPYNYFRRYYVNDFDASNSLPVYRNSNHREENHLSAVKIVDNNGTKYVYGLPAYNINESTVSFAVTGRSVDSNTGLVTYNAGDNSTSNSLGRSNYFDKTTVPAYAHSFLLTEVLSSDYIDRNSDGPTLDDIGSWHKFNYTEVYGAEATSTYKWRFPVAGGANGKEALYSRGVKGSKADDIGTYTYGEKEIWYVHSIESKNYIAEFYLADRDDAYGVNGEDGILSSNTLKRLDKIVLYNRADRIDNDTAAVPIQTIVFEYDYSLCKESPSNKYSYTPTHISSQSGKLTLKKIRVYKGESSEEMALSTYEFTYSSANPDFNYGDMDAWGNYRDNTTLKPTDLFPYAAQDPNDAVYAIAWKLTNIKTPQGGEIDVTYESDRYSYVQNHRAMRHFKVAGMTNLIRFLDIQDAGVFNATTQLYTNLTENMSQSTIAGIAGSSFANMLANNHPNDLHYTAQFGDFDLDRIPNNVIVFELEDEINSSLSWQEAADSVKRAYFIDNSSSPNYSLSYPFNPSTCIKGLLLKTHVNIRNNVDEYLPTFVAISEDYHNPFNDSTANFDDDFQAIGVMPPSVGSNYQYGYVIIDPNRINENLKNNGKDYAVHPIQFAAVEFARRNLQDSIYGACIGCNPDNIIDKEVVHGMDANWAMIQHGYASDFNTGLTTLRLYEPDNEKFGGGARVKQITYSDNWDVISGEYASSYTWKYEYSGGEKSGVAAWEPRSMTDENPFYSWKTYQNTNQKFPAEHNFTPTPVTELLYPGAVVGYSRVEVRFEGGYDKGYSVAEYYTSKDFPTIEHNSGIKKIDKVDKKNVLTGASINLYGYSQGYSVITNDYHGKPKSQSLYNKIGDIQSKTTYIYYGLNDELTMINRDGDISTERIGLEYDIHADSRYVSDHSDFASIGLNAKWLILPFPSPTPLIMPMMFATSRERGFYSHALIKHINKSAQVKEVQTIYMQSTNHAENLAYDFNTGSVIISSLTDEFDDKLYSFSYPAHWYYDQFRDRCSVEGLTTAGSISGQQLTTTASMAENFVAGDYIKITSATSTDYAYILYISGSTAYLITTAGAVYNNLSGSVTISLKDSGRENRLMESMQSMVTKKAPTLTGSTMTFPEDEIISTSVLTYRDRNNIKCRSSFVDGASNELIIGQQANPYVYGIKGKLVPDGQFAWQSPRVNATHAHGIRFDGWIDTLVPFYKLNTSDDEWYAINESSHPDYISSIPYQKWRKLGQTTLFDEYGKALESEDQIDVHSAVLYGYNNELVAIPVAQAVNARKQDIAFDGFEDYDYYLTTGLASSYETHFDFKDALTSGISVSQSFRHSGLSALNLGGSKSAQVTKNIGSVCANPGDGMTDSLFVADSCLCIPPFEPIPGKYIISAWVGMTGHAATTTTYTEGKIDVTVGGTTYTFLPSGPILDGWQRIEGVFTIPDTATTINVKLYNVDPLLHVYFDDVRIHPFLAGMTTVVYDPKTLLPLATHDGYNFTTFYNYDENLNQVRVRVETVEGIRTIMESEFGGKKSHNQP